MTINLYVPIKIQKYKVHIFGNKEAGKSLISAATVKVIDAVYYQYGFRKDILTLNSLL